MTTTFLTTHQVLSSEIQSTVYNRFFQKVKCISLKITHDESLAEDCAQDTFIQVFRKFDQFNPERGSFDAWIHRIAVNCTLQYLRKRKCVNCDGGVAGEKLVEPAVVLDQLSLVEFWEEWKKLPKRQRTVFYLHEIAGYSHVEIAPMLDISVGTSRSILSRARDNMGIR